MERKLVDVHFGRKVTPFEPIVEVRDCLACGKRFEPQYGESQDVCSIRCVRAYVRGKRAKKAGAK